MFYVSQPIQTPRREFCSEVQQSIYALIERLGIAFERVECDPGITMEQCRNIDSALATRVIKTILLTNRQKTAFYLYVTDPDRPFVTRDFSASMGIARVSFAPEDLMLALLGTPHGSATVLSVVADTDNKVKVVIDNEIAQREFIGCTDGDAGGFFKLRMADILEKYLPATGHRPTMI